jgi:hypothetical protein
LKPPIESIRLVRIARNTAVKAQTTAMITLKATLVTATDDLRSALEALTDYRLIVACAALVTEGDLVDPVSRSATRWLVLRSVGFRSTKR